jgi:serine/threonine-protein kinase
VEEAGGRKFLVMELVPGETLAERIKRGSLLLDEALNIAVQIAEALEAAHEKGVMHRDLKPANIKVTPNGQVKVLDFGLAKAFAGEAAVVDSSNSPTISMSAAAATNAGVILGTAAYMSPEQAKGQEVDHRTDIFAFGCVLYEMLTGRQAFPGEGLSEILASVLKAEPDWKRLPADTPAAVRRVLLRCLRKDRNRRLQTIGDARIEIEEASSEPEEMGPGATPAVPQRREVLKWIAAGGAAVAAGDVLERLYFRKPAEAPASGPPSVPIDIDLGPDALPLSASGPAAIISPDGAQLVFVATRTGGKSSLFTRRLDQPKATVMDGTVGAYGPFFSHDGQWVGFFADGKMKKIRLSGGDLTTLCAAPAGRGASWGDDNMIIAALDSNVGLSSVPADAGTPSTVTHLDPTTPNSGHRWPQVLPGSKAVLFTTSTNGDYREGSIMVASLKKDGHTRPLIEGKGMYGRFVAGGYLVYIHNGTLFGVRFDPERLVVLAGEPVRLLEQVSYRATGGSAELDFSQNGHVIYRSGQESALLTVQWLDAADNTKPILAEPSIYMFPRLSPDEKHMAVALLAGSNSDAKVYDLETGIGTRLTNSLVVFMNLTWSNPDGRYLVFRSVRGGMSWMRADGGAPQALTTSNFWQGPWSFPKDGGRLAFYQDTETGGEIWTVPVEIKDGQLRAGTAGLFLKVQSTSSNPAFSPDGNWIAYASTESGEGYEVYVRAFPNDGAKQQISDGGGMFPVWSQKSKELFYRNNDRRIMVAKYEVNGKSFKLIDKATVWSKKQLANTGSNPSFDLAPDGKRFAVLMEAANPEPAETVGHVTLIPNFFDYLRQRVPLGK